MTSLAWSLIWAALALAVAGMTRAAGIPWPFLTGLNDLQCLALSVFLFPAAVLMALRESRASREHRPRPWKWAMFMSLWVAVPVWLYGAAWLFFFVVTALERSF